MDSHHSLHRRPPCGFNRALATLVFAAKLPAISPIRMYLNGITATTTAAPVSIQIIVSVCCTCKAQTEQRGMLLPSSTLGVERNNPND